MVFPGIVVNKKENTGSVTTSVFIHRKGLLLDSGESLKPLILAYETYGVLNRDKSNAILVAHALSGDAHAAGFHQGERKPGWWNEMIGPGKAFDTDKYFVICSNVLGGCKGTTGPSSVNPATGVPFGLQFPSITIDDMVRGQKELVEHLGIGRLLCVAGGSMGGMQVLSWLRQFPERLISAIPVATCMKHTPQQIAFNEVGRQAIIADTHWNGGNYYGRTLPAKGLALARMVGHITYMSDTSMANKFGRQRKIGRIAGFDKAEFEVEDYLRYHGDNFVKRFDANSYLYITKAMDNFDCSGLHKAIRGREVKVMVIAFKSDWLYPAYQSKEIIRECKLAGVEATYCEVDSDYGHDAFLLETDEETHLISHFLKRVYDGKT